MYLINARKINCHNALIISNGNVRRRRARVGETPRCVLQRGFVLYAGPAVGVASDRVDRAVAVLHRAGEQVKKSDLNRQLFSAVAEGDLKKIKALVAEGADINARDTISRTPLHHAVKIGNEKIIRFLIEKGADVNSVTFDKDTPLHCAAEQGHVAIAGLLIQKGAKVTAENNVKDTPSA